MNQRHPDDLVIEIDEQIEVLLEEIDSAPDGMARQNLVDDLQEVLVSSVLGPFGLSSVIFKDQAGGNITTVHNFEAGVTANEADRARHENWEKASTQTFDRSDYQRDLPKERKKQFKEETKIVDGYTGKELPKDGRAHRDHVVSAHEIEKSGKGHLAQTREERVETANLDGNMVWADSSMNQSKGAKDLKDWAALPSNKDPSKTNGEVFGIDPDRVDAAYENARSTVNGAQNKAVFKKQATEFAVEGTKEGAKLAMRQIVGMIMVDVIQGVVQDIRALAKEGLQDVAHVARLLKARGEKTLKSLKEKWAHYLKEGMLAGLSGLLSGLITLLINSFITTMKNIVTIIRESTLAVVRSIKTILAPEPGMDSSDIARAVLKLLSGVAVVAIGIAFEESVKKLIEVTFLAPFAEAIAGVLTAMATGIGSLLILFAFDQIKSTLAFRNKRLADVHRGQTVTLLKIKKTTLMIEQAQTFAMNTSAELSHRLNADRTELNELRSSTSIALGEYDQSVLRLAALAKGF